MYINKNNRSRRVFADDEIDQEVQAPVEDEMVDEGGEGAEINVDPEATELLFETDDVAQLVAEVTEQPVDVVVDEDAVVFTVGDVDYTVEPEGDEELLAAATRVRAGKKPVKASKRFTPTKKPVKAGTQTRQSRKVVRRVNK